MRQKNSGRREHRLHAVRIEPPSEQADRAPEQQERGADDHGGDRDGKVDDDRQRALAREPITRENVGGEGSENGVDRRAGRSGPVDDVDLARRRGRRSRVSTPTRSTDRAC